MVTVGTDHHRFDRLVTWVDSWAASHPTVPVLIQRGEAGEPDHAESVPLLPHPDLVAAMAAADVVVAQGGPAAIADARAAGRLPVVVPRRREFGEHVDDHQVGFVASMARQGLVATAATEAELHRWLDRAIAEPGLLRIVPDDGAADAAVAAFRAVVDPLLAARRGRR